MPCTLQGLLNLGGKSVYTNRIAGHYTNLSLCQAWSSAATAMAAQAGFGSVWHLALAADQLVCASQMLHEYGPIQSLTVISLPGPGIPHIQYTSHACFCSDRCAYATQAAQAYVISRLQPYWDCNGRSFDMQTYQRICLYNPSEAAGMAPCLQRSVLFPVLSHKAHQC